MRAQARNVLVIGAASAIGRAIVDAFVAHGDTVTATFNRTAPPDASSARWLPLDLSDAEAVEAFGQQRVEEGALDVLVSVAGYLPGRALHDYDRPLIDKVMAVNVNGPAQLVGVLQPVLGEGAAVLMMGSISGERGSYDPMYAAAKAAVLGFVKAMATHRLAKARYVAISPALVDGSDMGASMSDERRAFHLGQSPLGKLITVPDLARIVFDLSLDHWAYANGSSVRVNGGLHV